MLNISVVDLGVMIHGSNFIFSPPRAGNSSCNPGLKAAERSTGPSLSVDAESPSNLANPGSSILAADPPKDSLLTEDQAQAASVDSPR